MPEVASAATPPAVGKVAAPKKTQRKTPKKQQKKKQTLVPPKWTRAAMLANWRRKKDSSKDGQVAVQHASQTPLSSSAVSSVSNPKTPGAASELMESVEEDGNVSELDVCVKCEEDISSEEQGSLGKKSKQPIHQACCSTYKSVQRKKGKDKKFEAWFTSLEHAQVVDYYAQRRKASCKGKYCKIGEATVRQQTIDEDADLEDEKFVLYPFRVHEDDCKKEGMTSVVDILAAWHKQLVDPANTVIDHNGQKIIKQFVGIELTRIKAISQDSSGLGASEGRPEEKVSLTHM